MNGSTQLYEKNEGGGGVFGCPIGAPSLFWFVLLENGGCPSSEGPKKGGYQEVSHQGGISENEGQTIHSKFGHP